MTPNTTTTTQAAIELLRAITSRFTRHHRDLRIDGKEMGAILVLTLQGHRDDHPKLVGSKGGHIGALQAIFSAAGRKAGKVVRLTLLDPVTGTKLGPSEFVENPTWEPRPTMDLVGRIVSAVSTGGAEIDAADTGSLTTILVRPYNMRETEARWDALARPLHLLVHAIGKTEGRTIHLDILDAEGNPLPNGQGL